MRAVMLSIQPKWCKLIADGKKTVEVRKNRPKIATPFKCYIYCTQGFGKNTFNVPISFEKIREHYIQTESMVCLNSPIGNCKVIGEFVCDSITMYPWVEMDGEMIYFIPTEEGAATCMEYPDVVRYGAGKHVYFWHISNLKLYDNPKELGEFWFPPEIYCEPGLCGGCPKDQCMSESGDYMYDCEWEKPLTHPPQSWCYVEGK